MGNATQSALVINVAAAEPIVSMWRKMYDPGAAWGVPAHITVLYPFVPPATLDEATLERISELIGTIEAFDFVLDRVGQFTTEVLYLAPEPSEQFVALTQAMVTAWPQHQPYEGAYNEVVPHLTIAHTNRGASFDAIASRVREELPIRSRAENVALMTGTMEHHSWHTVREFALG